MIDDDLMQDGDDVPMPATSTLADALAEAYIVPLFDVGDNNDEVPFKLNVENTRIELFEAKDWDTWDQNAEAYWVTYLLGAFQGPLNQDDDPNNQPNRFSQTDFDNGGSLIYIESMNELLDEYVPWIVEDVQEEYVVREVGRALTGSMANPVTRFDWDDLIRVFSRYTEEFLLRIRESQRPVDHRP